MFKWRHIILLVACVIAPYAVAQTPKHLDDFHDADEFDRYLNDTLNSCLDGSAGGTKAAGCFTRYYETWDAELNRVYQRLRKQLPEGEQQALKTAQLVWLQHRDQTLAFNAVVLDTKYADMQGTMFVAMRAGDTSAVVIPIVKAQVVLLSDWYEALSGP